MMHVHICPICDMERERPDCQVDDDKATMDEISCWEACPQHQAQWEDQIYARPGAFDTGE
jgi:hypothetical protein